MNNNSFDLIVIGSGLAGLVTALRIAEESEKMKIAIISRANGATPYITVLNAVAESNLWGDSEEQYINDMLQAGYFINDKKLVVKMCRETLRCIDFLLKWNINFSKGSDGKFLRRHASGSSYPRSLFQEPDILGKQIIFKLKEHLLNKKEVYILENKICRNLLVKDGKIFGATIEDFCDSSVINLFAPVVVAAWGGIGNLFLDSTYPSDIDGTNLSIAYEAGVSLVDLEFIEFEPLVIKWPEQIKGIICPTSILGDGAHLLNSKREQFILKHYQKEEAGCKKTVLNKAIWQEIKEKRGSEHGGIYIDLKNIPTKALNTYPWFYNKILKEGVDPEKVFLEVAPVAHSHSGGIRVKEDYQTNVDGLYAVGEAMGGTHGADRLAGNAATQALVSGILGAEEILGREHRNIPNSNVKIHKIQRNKKVYKKVVPKVKNIVKKIIGIEREENILIEGIKELKQILNSREISDDDYSYKITLSSLLIAQSCLIRKESRGNHFRSDYPNIDKDWQCSIEIKKSNKNSIEWGKIPRNNK